MSSGCRSSLSCVDARVPVRATYVNLYKWPESDAEFVKSVTRGGGDGGGGGRVDDRVGSTRFDGRRRWSTAPTVVDSYSCRQIYLRSYTFSRKESVPEKTLRCLGRVKERAAVFPFLQQKNEDAAGSVDGDNSSKKSIDKRKTKTKRRRRKKKKKACVTARKLREVSYSTLCFIFHRLLSCTSSVDVVDRG
ncbi:hypothetical protein B296_00005872 [Ensete ventricosum]|uniref:Uncharacterized protein n=1 Tax=Ensete ventricosum TaxID=4639 RepID=A0A427AM06_ENSVE|nr:hypothetical protein B296_00005872 [Ensete ventricosum]